MFSKATVLFLTSTLAVCRTNGGGAGPDSEHLPADWCTWLGSVQPLPKGWECLTLPGYHSTGGFGTKEYPLQTTFDACNLAEGTLPLLFKHEPSFEKVYEYKSSLAVKAGASVDLSLLRVPFLGGISVSTNANRTVEISVKVRLKEAHVERLTNLPVVFSQSPGANRICLDSICEPQTFVTAEVFAAAPEIVLESSSEFTVSTGASILKIIKAHGSVEKDTSTKNTLSAPKPVVLASHQAQAASYAKSLCAPKWSCVNPSIRIHADCELGDLGAKNSDDRTITSFGSHGAGTFCQHDAPNTGHAKVSVGCTATDSAVALDYSVDLFAKGGSPRVTTAATSPQTTNASQKLGSRHLLAEHSWTSPQRAHTILFSWKWMDAQACYNSATQRGNRSNFDLGASTPPNLGGTRLSSSVRRLSSRARRTRIGSNRIVRRH